jgi:lysophospholipase L1-like esterase
MTTLLLIGDSHLARLSESHVRHLAAACGTSQVVREAVPGATSLDITSQLDQTSPPAPAFALISVGSNDAAGETCVALDLYRSSLGEVLHRLRRANVVVLGPPPVSEARVDHDRTNARLAAYAAAAAEVATEHHAAFVPTNAVLGNDLDELLEDDGLHLSAHGYEKIVAALADALWRLSRSGPGLRPAVRADGSHGQRTETAAHQHGRQHVAGTMPTGNHDRD